MNSIVIIGANDFQNPLILKAKEMGYETHVFAWKDGSIGERTADFFYPISITEKEKILEICRRIKPVAVTTIASDLANITVHYLCKNLGLPSNSDHTLFVTTNKYAMRCELKNKGIKVPNFKEFTSKSTISAESLKGFRYPLIIKPTDRSGSRGIFKVSNFTELEEKIKISLDLSFEDKVIVEEFIEGNEYSCESISFNGKHQILAITKKYTTGSPNFIETGHVEPSDLSPDMVVRVKDFVCKILDALNIQTGPAHTEFKINNNEIEIIEIGSRMGGDCIGSHLVKLSTGYDFLKMTIQTSLGEQPDMQVIGKKYFAGIRFIFNENDLNILNELKNSEYLYFYSDIENSMNAKVTDSSSRKGYFILRCESKEELMKWMKK